MTKKELKARCKELGISTEGLTTNALLEEAIAKREAELEAEKKAAAEKEAAEKAAAEKEAAEKAAAEKEAAEKAAAEKEAAEKAAAEKAAAEKAAAEKAKEGTASSQEKKPSTGGSPEEEESAQSEEAPEPKRLVHEDKQGRKWAFKERAPKTLNIDGHPMSQEEIFDNEDVISELVYGNCSFLTQIHE